LPLCDCLADWGIEPLVDGVHPLFVNLFPIHREICGSGNADPHFAAVDSNDFEADIVADHDFFADFPREHQHTRSLIDEFAGNAKLGLLQQAVREHIGLWKRREDDQRERLLDPDKTGDVIPVNQEASSERGIE
jgi:hypothetical protein